MTSKWTRAIGTAALAVVCAGGLGGCAEERDPINRVQANALHKSFFVGDDIASDADNPEFYANGTLTDIGYGAAHDGIFSAFYSNDMSIIRWEITEQYLLGRVAYERVDGSDGKGAGKRINDGQVIYSFPIQSHFDIRHAYNPSTGEEQNIIEENTSDRPWNEREYFRVDWSRNLITSAYDFDTLAFYQMFDAVEYEEVGYYVNDPTDENAPHFEVSDSYFDVTTRALAKPGEIDLSHLGWGIDKFPSCFLDADFSGGTFPSGSCNPVEVSIRHSFWKRPNTDYEPQHWDGHRFQSAGAFLKERLGYARKYGMSDQLWRRFIQRYNIWKRSHFYKDPAAMTGPIECYTPEKTPVDTDPRRDVDPANGTHDECEQAGAGSQCDVYNQKCTLPYNEREVRPIVWYFTNKSDYTYFDATFAASQDWDVAMKMAVQAARNAECYRTGGADCETTAPVPHGEMTNMTDLVDIEREVDACRREKGTWDVNACAAVVDQELAERGYQGQDLVSLRQIALMDDAVVLCHSPVEAGDHPACAPGKPRLPEGVTSVDCQEAYATTGDQATLEACSQAYTVRIGDVRHHLINVIKSPETPSPWGFGPTYADPLTGEGISASINVWAAPTEQISQGTVDIARFIAGELKPSDVTDGKYVKDWVKAAELADKGRSALPPMDRATYDQRLNEIARSISRDLEHGDSVELPSDQLRWGQSPQMPAGLESQMGKLNELRHVRAAVDAPSTRTPVYAARMENARGSLTEAELINKPMMDLAGIDGTAPVEMQALASPLRGHVNPTMQRQLRHMKEHGLAQRGACLLNAEDHAPSPTAMIGLSKHLQTKFGAFNPADPPSAQLARAEKMRRYMADKMHYAVIIHEMGHTFGFRHNFVSSSSAINYRPQYWQLRTKNGTVTTPCTDLAAGDEAAGACVGPRYFDPVTTEESDNLIHMWMHSSTMDYAGDYTQDLLGLGAWDFHAARMFYGDVAAVYEDADLGLGTPLSAAIHESVLDTFGGILGYVYQNAPAAFPVGNLIHYSQLQATYGLINNCQPVDPEAFRPSWWDVDKHGEWHPTLDGLLVQVDGQWSRCFGRRVAYADWDDLTPSTSGPASAGGQIAGGVGPGIHLTGQTGEACNLSDGTPCNGGGSCFGGMCYSGRTRVPYGFATDRWADLGNLAVYRHDNGADAYEIFEFFISEQELRHIFDNYRRDRMTFSVRGASDRILTRYNTKMRDGAKGVALYKNFFTNIALENGWEPNGFFWAYGGYWGYIDTLLASGLAFDHFARQVARPHIGPHEDPGAGSSHSVVLRSAEFLTPQESAVVIPDGAQGFWNTVGIGGKKVNNTLANDQGEYDAYYTMNAGSYYDKVFAPMLLTESVDNFISSSLDDFTDARFRSVSMADLFSDGYRRFLANNLTDDDWAKAPRIAATSSGAPMVDEEKYPNQPMGWISWWTDTPQLCFSNTGSMVCTGYDQNGTPFEPNTPQFTRPVDPQVGWEMQKFLITMTMVYLPENQKQTWKDMLSIWAIGDDSDPGFQNRIELHVPNGDVYVARTYGTEQICFEQCQTVQRGIGARILEHANRLLEAAYEVTPVTQNGVTWYIPVLDGSGSPMVKFDSGLEWINPNFTFGTPPPNCNATDNSGCKCEHNRACKALEAYVSVPEFVRMAVRDFDLWTDVKGVY